MGWAGIGFPAILWNLEAVNWGLAALAHCEKEVAIRRKRNGFALRFRANRKVDWFIAKYFVQWRAGV